MSFEQQVMKPLRRSLPHIRSPSKAGAFELLEERGRPVLVLRTDQETLAGGLQTDQVAGPFFLACFGFWYEHLTGRDPALRVEVAGPSWDLGPNQRRSWIALEALQQSLGDRLEIRGWPARVWPRAPVLNHSDLDRDGLKPGAGREARAEAQLCDERRHARPLGLDRFYRQLPLGLFDGRVAEDSAWTPGKGARADLWGVGLDGAFHLFELKVGDRPKVGVLPELFAYAWILAMVRGGEVLAQGPAVDALRAAPRLNAWTLAPRLHPLLHSHGRSPLSWLARGLKGTVELGALFFEEQAGPRPFKAWLPERTWRPQG